ncbi:MAG: prephenate dehydrogenase/arogenate dehydrogenase family protein, partial [Spirochaetales bacterium]|nr:prephenate dehydrogenase/arogenate dehydrogenase family protein [Spirochaetales bacterium]
MQDLCSLTYGIVGLGIMGGSIAKAIRQNLRNRSEAKGRIYACNRSTASLSQAMSEGVIDGGYSSENVDEMLRECDILFICLYPHATLDFMRQHRESFKTGSIMTDISGVKGIFPPVLAD